MYRELVGRKTEKLWHVSGRRVYSFFCITFISVFAILSILDLGWTLTAPFHVPGAYLMMLSSATKQNIFFLLIPHSHLISQVFTRAQSGFFSFWPISLHSKNIFGCLQQWEAKFLDNCSRHVALKKKKEKIWGLVELFMRLQCSSFVCVLVNLASLNGEGCEAKRLDPVTSRWEKVFFFSLLRGRANERTRRKE